MRSNPKMTPDTVSARATTILILLALGTACSPAEPDFASIARNLRAEPAGDPAWRQALTLARQEDRLPEFLALARETALEQPERWEPPWAEAKCIRDEDGARARELFDRARRLAVELDDPHGIASCANDLGWMDFIAGDLEQAQARYERGIAAAQVAGRTDLEAFLRNNLAGLFVRTGEFARSREQLERAENRLIELGLVQAARWAALNRASIHLELGDAAGARDLLEALHREALEAADAWTLDASAVILGSLDLAQDRPVEARSWYEKTTREIPELADGADFGLGRALLREGRHAEAAAVLHAAAERARPRHAVRALNLEVYAAHASALSGDDDAARAKLERLVETADAAGAGEARWTARAFLGKLVLRLDGPAAAIPLLEASIAILEEQNAPLDPMGEGLQFLRERREPYVDLALAWARSGDGSASRILDIAGRVQARARAQRFGDTELDGAAPATLAALQARLPAGSLLLDYLVGEQSGILLAIRRDRVRAVPIDGRQALAEPLESYRRALRSLPADLTAPLDAAAREDGLDLSRRLIGPIEDWLPTATRLYVVPDRELALLPFAALPLQAGGHLGDIVETALLLRPGAPPAWDSPLAPVLLGGLPDLAPDSGFEALPWTGYELSGIRELWGDERSDLLTEAAFSLAGLGAAGVERYGTIHLATHAVASTRDPRRCGVVLSAGEKLDMAGIAALELRSSLVVLSACRTGEGELLPGQGVIGLGWAFLQAGARGIVVSQWTVDDVASAKLMIAFHARLREGDDPVRALTRARRELEREHPHPSLWAPFVVVLRPS